MMLLEHRFYCLAVRLTFVFIREIRGCSLRLGELRTIYLWRNPTKNGCADDPLVILKSARTSNRLAVATSNVEWLRGLRESVLTMADVNGKEMIGVAWTM